MSSLARALVCAALLVCSPASAGPLRLDLPTALARARERAPEAIAALAHVGEATARRIGAGALADPEVQLGAGARLGDPRSLAMRGQLVQPLEPGRRGARERLADAGIEHARALGDDVLRTVERATADAFYEARFAELSVELAIRGEQLATRMTATAERRRKAGDITDLDVDLAKIATGRARSAVATARAAHAEALGRLAVLVGAATGDAITLAGELAPPALPAPAGPRADVRALAAETRVARAEGALAQADGRPDVGIWFGYERDERDSIVLGGLTFTLPIWNGARSERATARAHQRSAEVAHAAVATLAAREVADALAAYAHAREAVEVIERDVLPALDDGEQLLERSIDAGQLAVADYLLMRQQILDGRREHLERKLALAKAAVAARFTGVSP